VKEQYRSFADCASQERVNGPERDTGRRAHSQSVSCPPPAVRRSTARHRIDGTPGYKSSGRDNYWNM